MISERLKQRLVGIAVLVALAVIFIPVLFNLQPSRPLDTTSQIPAAPDIKPAAIDKPMAPEVAGEVPDQEQVFDSPEDEWDAALAAEEALHVAEVAALAEEQAKLAPKPEPEAAAKPAPKPEPALKPEPKVVKPEPKPAPKPAAKVEPPRQQVVAKPKVEPKLAQSGLPESWVIQVISYREQPKAMSLAAKLQQAGIKGYQQPGNSAGSPVYRVYVGPFVLRQTAEAEKRRIDSLFKVNALILPFEP